ncbi:MAG: RnfABCDGE type electron transport complex subunit D [Candidatus Kaiserbacteria bacterium]|nr:RnfABCDGE type electron transport complex subunit D [Candidatus Kaiserbacteria bacterium]
MITLISRVQRWLDGITMYRVVTGGLCFLVVVSFLLGSVGLVSYSFSDQVTSLVVALGVAVVSNVVFARLFRVSAQHESAVITALIIFFLVIPATSFSGQWVVAVVAFAAVASKFLFVWRQQHIVNPAAFGVLVLSAPGLVEAAWWIGSFWLFVPLVIVGFLVVMKIRRWPLVLWCIGTAFIVYVFEAWRLDLSISSSVPTFFLSWPILFLAFFMLTEPFTTPPTKKMQMYYGALVGGLSSAVFFAPYIAMSPELALIIGNLTFFSFSLRRKLHLTLIRAKEVAKNTREFVFTKPEDVRFRAGQYLEWMLPHRKPDNRGVRRYFTIASAPHEDVLRIAVRFSEGGSTYKQALRQLAPGDCIIASQRAGDFLLPDDPTKKLGFVAGGIGVTPFLSHFGDIARQGVPRDIALFYCNNTSEEIAYRDMLDALTDSGQCTVVHILAEEKVVGCEYGLLTEDGIKKYTPDYQDRLWYLSGPPGMVYAYTTLLQGVGVPNRNIVRDFFPGLA